MPHATRHQDPQQDRSTRTDAAFKPVALPALAAAVEAGKDKPQEERRHEPPPILKDSAFD